MRPRAGGVSRGRDQRKRDQRRRDLYLGSCKKREAWSRGGLDPAAWDLGSRPTPRLNPKANTRRYAERTSASSSSSCFCFHTGIGGGGSAASPSRSARKATFRCSLSEDSKTAFSASAVGPQPQPLWRPPWRRPWPRRPPRLPPAPSSPPRGRLWRGPSRTRPASSQSPQASRRIRILIRIRRRRLPWPKVVRQSGVPAASPFGCE